MLDEANLRRLAEMGIDVYVSRVAAARAAKAVSAVAPAVADSIPAIATLPYAQPTSRAHADAPVAFAPTGQAAVVLLADITSASANALLAGVARALKLAGIACAHGEARDEAVLAAASALIMFGDRHARTVGALLPARRQREIGWIVSAELPALAGDAPAKRALWSELKRLIRELAVRSDPARR